MLQTPVPAESFPGVPWEAFGWSALAVSATMAVSWAVLLRLDRTSLVDVAWTAAMGVLALVYAAIAPGWEPRRILIAVLVGIWAVRLAGHLWKRISRDGGDGRYTAMEEALGDKAKAFLFVFFQMQAVAALTFALPFLILASDPAPGFRALEYLGVAVWVAGFLGESIADAQLDRFRRDPTTKGRVCRSGLWAWSRHPNYFFEWTMWIGYALIGFGAPLGWIPALGALAMLLMILKISGVPYAEQQSLRSRGDAYRTYQQEVPVFFPRRPQR